MTDLKYLTAYSIPVTAVMGLSLGNYFSFITPVYVFVIIPILEIVITQDQSNLSEEGRNKKQHNPFFELLLYINIPIVISILIYTLIHISSQGLLRIESIGMFLSTGIVLGANGINVAHELGHRKNRVHRTLAKLLLLPSLYMHFYMEHNFGHHLHAATKEDPATAKISQSIYSFWLTSVTRQYQNAWKIQLARLRKNQSPFVSIANDMLWYTLIQSSYLCLLYLYLGYVALLTAILCAIVGFLLLESINYIEHYGLLRSKLKSGRYERVKEIHSWNSNHLMGRIVLYELTRHSDHHFKSSKKYQLLDYHNESPQLPYGYPTSMVISLIPPLWFSIMNKRIPSHMKEQL